MTSIRTQAEQFWNRPSEEEARKVISHPAVWEKEIQPHLEMLFDDDPCMNEYLVHGSNDITALEIGCGIGRLLAPLSKYGWDMHGIDISENMLRFGEEYLKSRNALRVRTSLVSDTTFPCADSTFNLVYSLMVFQHIPERAVITGYLKEAHRVLKPGGMIRVQTHRGSPPPVGEFHGYAGHMYSSAESFAAEFVAAGFKVLSTQTGLGHPEWLWVTATKQA